MGNVVEAMEAEAYPSLLCLPRCENLDQVCEQFSITKLEQNKDIETAQHVASVNFPKGWSCKSMRDKRHATFYDADNMPRFSAFMKYTPYDKYGYISIFSDVEITNMIKENKEQEIKSKKLQDLMESTVKTFDNERPFLMYKYTENRSDYEQCLAGHRLYDIHPRSEFARHKLVGFFKSEQEAVNFACNLFPLLTDTSFDGFIIHQLADGIENLDRFEIEHMFEKCDSNHKPKPGYKKAFISNDTLRSNCKI